MRGRRCVDVLRVSSSWSLSLMHRFDDVDLRERAVSDLPLPQALRNDADDFPTLTQHRIGELAHQSDRTAAEDEAMPRDASACASACAAAANRGSRPEFEPQKTHTRRIGLMKLSFSHRPAARIDGRNARRRAGSAHERNHAR